MKYQTIAQQKDRLVLKLLGVTMLFVLIVNSIAYVLSDNFMW